MGLDKKVFQGTQDIDFFNNKVEQVLNTLDDTLMDFAHERR